MCILLLHHQRPTTHKSKHKARLIMDIVLLFLNIRSLPQHKPLFETLLLEEKVHAFLLNETHLTAQSKCKISGYQFIQNNSTIPAQRANGGVALGFKPTIPHRMHHITQLNLPEYIISTLYFKNLYVTLVTIYIRPGHIIPLQFFQHISNNFKTYIIMADVNIHSRSDRQKDQFRNFITNSTNGILQHLPKPTRPISQTTPDIVILSPNLIHRTHIEVLDTVGSDHVPIKITLHRQPSQQPNPPILRTTTRFDLANWNHYRDHISDRLESVQEPTNEEELYQTLNKITDTIQAASKRYIPTTKISSYQPKLPPNYLTQVKRSRQAFRDYIRTRNPASLQLHRQLQRSVHNYITAYKLRQWIKTCNQLRDTAHPTRFWKRFNILTGKRTKTSYPLLQDDQLLQTDTDKANAFASYLQEIFRPTHPHIERTHPANRLNITSPALQPHPEHRVNENSYLTAPITVNEIATTIARKKNTAPGMDSITYRHIKEGPLRLLQLIAAIFNFILRTGFIPAEWKTSKTLMFLKPDKPPSSVTSYRPIQLTPTLSKILERIIVKRLHVHLHDRNLLPIHQAGFRPGYSIQDQLLRLSNHITNHFNTCKPSCLVLFDLEKAFDKVWHHGLIWKLLNFHLPIAYIRYIYNFITERLAYITINHSSSFPVFLQTGVPQGSALSPLLYILYCSDLPPLPANIQLYQYADDTAFLATARTIQQINHTMQTAIDSFIRWCSKWKLTINALKTQAIVFLPPKQRSRVQRNPSKLQLHVQQTHIRPSHTVKYLGITFDHHLTWNPYLKQLTLKAYNRLNLLKRLTGTTWGMAPSTIINTYKAFLRPVLTYGHTAWVSAPQSFYTKLKILERHAFRIAHRIKLPSPTADLYARVTIPNILFHIETLRLRYVTGRYENNHPLLLDTIQQNASYTHEYPLLITNPLSLLFSIYITTLPDNHIDLPQIASFTAPNPPDFILPSNALVNH